MPLDFRPTLKTALEKGRLLSLSPPLHSQGRDGRRLSRRHGNALEFADYREYQPGDDLRRLDWRVFARNDQLLTKQFSEEIEPRCELIVDQSASQQITPAKAQATLAVAAILAAAAENAGFRLTVWQAAEQWRCEPQPERPLEWQHLDFTARRSPGETLEEACWQLRPRGLRILLSDLLWPDSPRKFLQLLREGTQSCLVLQMLSRADLQPELNGLVTLIDAETAAEHSYFLDAEALAQGQERLRRHQNLWLEAAENCGVVLLTLVAEQFLDTWDLQPLCQAGILQ
ncbi:MAG: DUF58 domain-containing protein [Oligosphaeraceae bacterium]|nr:DUF58 domain-containing protein [Oligosphaeraceae bacterium]